MEKINISEEEIKIIFSMMNNGKEKTTTEIAKEIYNDIKNIYDLRKKDIKVRRALEKLEKKGILISEKVLKRKVYKINENSVGIAKGKITIQKLNGKEIIKLENLALKVNGKWLLVNVK